MKNTSDNVNLINVQGCSCEKSTPTVEVDHKKIEPAMSSGCVTKVLTNRAVQKIGPQKDKNESKIVINVFKGVVMMVN